MDFDTEAADDFYRAVKSWEHILPGYLNCAGADSDDSESDNGLLTPPPDCENTFEKAWILPPPRPTYADSWIRVMKRRVGEVDNFSSEHDSDSDVSSISSLSADSYPAAYVAYDTPTDAHGYHCPGSDVSGGLVFSDGSSDGEYKEGSTATAADAEDLFAEMLNTYTVPKSLKSVITGASQQKRKASSRSQSRGKPSGISKRSLRSSPRTSPRGRSFKT